MLPILGELEAGKQHSGTWSNLPGAALARVDGNFSRGRESRDRCYSSTAGCHGEYPAVRSGLSDLGQVLDQKKISGTVFDACVESTVVSDVMTPLFVRSIT